MTYKAKLVPMEYSDFIPVNAIIQFFDGSVILAKREYPIFQSDRVPGQRLVITDETGKEVAAYPTMPDVPQIDLSDIRRWIDEGCKESVELEVIKYFSEHLGGTITESPLLTNNTVKMVWGERKTINEVFHNAGVALPDDMKPATDWEALRDKFMRKFVSYDDTSLVDIFNFFKNEINGK